MLAAASKVFGNLGYTGATTDAIAKAAGVSQAYVVRTFGSKENLFAEASERALSRIKDAFTQVTQETKRDDPKNTVGRAYVELMADQSNLLIVMHLFTIGQHPRFGPIARAGFLEIYRVIYDALNDVKDAMSGMLAPKYREVVQGKVEIRQVMKFSKALVAGSYVLEGKITNSSKIRILRDNIVAFDGELDSLRRFKDDVKEVAAGYECGITIKDYRDFQEGDIIEAYTMEEIETSITEANKEAAKRRDQQEQVKKDMPPEDDA